MRGVHGNEDVVEQSQVNLNLKGRTLSVYEPTNTMLTRGVGLEWEVVLLPRAGQTGTCFL